MIRVDATTFLVIVLSDFSSFLSGLGLGLLSPAEAPPRAATAGVA